MRYLSVAALFGLIVGATPVQSQNPPPPARRDTSARPNNAYRFRVLGVFDEQTGDPVEGVEVADVLSGNSSLTTGTGTVSLFFLPDGGSLVRLRKIGYEVQTLPVSISPADTVPITIVLTRATQLPTVVVTDSAPRYTSPGLRAFEERRAKGIGRFVSEAVMRKNDDKTLADLITTTLPGLQGVPGPGGSKYVVSSRRPCQGPALRRCTTADCYVSVYIDGVRTYDASTMTDRNQIPDFGRMNPRDYAGAEFYPGGASVPAQYNATNSGCGVLLLWTRER